MNTHFPITEAINRDASTIILALNRRVNDVKNIVDNQSLARRVSIVALDLIGLASGLVSIACLPVIAFTVSLAALPIAAIAVTLSITSLALSIFFHPRSRGESLVKDYWKHLFQAIRKGNGQEIIQTCQELAKQEKQRPAHFQHCLGIKSDVAIEPFWKAFLHKTSLVGYLLMAIDNFRLGDEEKGQMHSDQALSHFEASGFFEEVQRYLKDLKDPHSELRDMIRMHNTAKGVHSLDYLLSLRCEQ